MATNTEQLIRERVDAFVADIADLIRQTALESVNEALGGTPARRGRPKKAAAAGAAQAPAKRRRRKGGKRIRRTAEEVEALAEKLHDAIASAPGSGLSSIADSLGEEIKDVRRPVHMLIEAGRIKTTGQRRGMKYFPAGKRKAAKKR